MNVAVQKPRVQPGQAAQLTPDTVLLPVLLTKGAQGAWLSAAGGSPKAHRACGCQVTLVSPPALPDQEPLHLPKQLFLSQCLALSMSEGCLSSREFLLAQEH